MGKRGPPKLPTPILKRRGGWRSKDRNDAPDQDETLPITPTWLKGYALAAWKQLVPLLKTLGVLRQIDGFALGRYCELYSEWRHCREHVRKNGRTFNKIDTAGNKVRRLHPEVKLGLELSAQLTRLEREFGLTPAARATLVVSTPEAEKRGAKREGDKSRFFRAG